MFTLLTAVDQIPTNPERQPLPSVEEPEPVDEPDVEPEPSSSPEPEPTWSDPGLPPELNPELHG